MPFKSRFITSTSPPPSRTFKRSTTNLGELIPSDLNRIYLPPELRQQPTDSLFSTGLSDNDAIHALNEGLLDAGSFIQWNPDKADLLHKLKGEKTYAKRTAHQNYKNLPEIIDWLDDWIYYGDKNDYYLVVDYANLFYSIKEKKGKTKRLTRSELMNDILTMLCGVIRQFSCTRIILSIQNNFSDKSFFSLIRNLIRCGLPRNSIHIIPAHNRAAGDDLYTIISAERVLKYKRRLLIITDDQYRDFYYENKKKNISVNFLDILPSPNIIINSDTLLANLASYPPQVNDAFDTSRKTIMKSHAHHSSSIPHFVSKFSKRGGTKKKHRKINRKNTLKN
jgi:hypothetical protein